VKDAPPYDSAVPPSRDQEMDLYQHHGRNGYWTDEAKFESPQIRGNGPAAQAAAQAQMASMRPRA